MANEDVNTEPSANGVDNGAGEAANRSASLNALAQYVKDFSFENPRAPHSLTAQAAQPQINITVNVNVNPLNENDYEVLLKIEADAKAEEEVVFNVELIYAGVFRITGLDQAKVHPVVFIECPRLLFPFARQIIAEATRNGGFPPLMIDPVDFTALYKQQIMNMQESGQQAAPKADA